MALGKRLIIYGSDIKGENTTINVYREGYVGEPVERDGVEDYLEIKKADSNSDGLNAIYGAQTVIRFKCNFDREFLDLYTENAKDVFVEVLKGETNEVQFYGYIEPSEWSEDYIDPPYEVSFSAYDQLGELDNIDFVDDNGAEYTGTKTFIEILAIILQKTSLQLNFNTAINFRQSGSTGDPLAVNRVDVQCFKEKTCKEVLENIIPKCRIEQRGGQWWIVNYEYIAGTSGAITFYKYTYAGGAAGTTAVSLSLTDPYYFIEKARLDIQKSAKQITVAQDFGYNDNLIKNGDFASKIQMENWASVGVSPEIRSLDDDGKKFVYLSGGKQKPEFVVDITYGISQSFQVEATSSVLKISLYYALMGTLGKSAKMFVRIKLLGTSQTYWATQIDGVDGAERTFEFQTLPFVVSLKVDKDQLEDVIEAYPWNQIQDKFSQFTISMPGGIPQSGILTVQLLAAYTNDATIAGPCYHTIKAELLQENGDSYDKSQELTIMNNFKNNYEPDDIELVVGSIPDIQNKSIVYHGGITDSSAIPVQSKYWKLDGEAATYGYAELIGRLALSNIRTPQHSFNAELGNITLGMGMVITEPSSPGRRFVENGMTYNDRMRTFQGTWTELLPPSTTAFTATIETSDTSSGGSGTGSTTPVVIVGGGTSSPHVEAGTRIELESAQLTVIFTKEFPAPPRMTHLRVYRWRDLFGNGYWKMQDVEWHFPAADAIKVTEFSIVIDASEDLTGIIVEYKFE